MEGDRAREMFLAHDVAVGRERRVRGGRTKSVWRWVARMDTSICVNRPSWGGFGAPYWSNIWFAREWKFEKGVEKEWKFGKSLVEIVAVIWKICHM